jgi:hypothetical protein
VEQLTPPQAKNNRFTAGSPEVIVDFIFEEGLFFIAVENIGDRPALKVSVRFEPGFRGAGGQLAITELALFKNIEFLAPHKAIRTFLDDSTAYFRREEPVKITVQVSYQDRHEQHYQDIIHHDLSIYQDIGLIQRTSDRGSARSDIPI